MVKALFDTNILIDYLNGFEQAKAELARYSDKAISLITWMEVIVGAQVRLPVQAHGLGCIRWTDKQCTKANNV